jgi:hypothetical protein
VFQVTSLPPFPGTVLLAVLLFGRYSGSEVTLPAQAESATGSPGARCSSDRYRGSATVPGKSTSSAGLSPARLRLAESTPGPPGSVFPVTTAPCATYRNSLGLPNAPLRSVGRPWTDPA